MRNLSFFLLLLCLRVNAGEVQYVLASAVNLRESPGASARIVAKLPIATAVKVLESEGMWRRVVTKSGDQSGQNGWLMSEFLTGQQPTAESVMKAAEAAGPVGRLMWADRVAAMDRLAAEDLRRQMPSADERRSLFPFADLNSVKPRGIYKADSGIVFRTASGIKIFDPATKAWRYGVTRPIGSFSAVSYDGLLWEALSIGGVELPKWYPVGSYTGITDVHADGNSLWLLVTQPYVGGGYISQDVVDVKRGKIYVLPYERYTSLLVDGQTAWLGSVDGVTAIDLPSLARTDYLTLPISKGVVDAFSSGGKVYYGAVDAGVFIIQRDSGGVQPLQAVNRSMQQGYRLEDMVLYEGQLFCLMSSVGKSGYLEGRNALLGVHDLKTGSTRIIDTGLEFVDKLSTHDGRVYGHGHLTEWYEGGQRGQVAGGVFEYRLAGEKFTKLTDQPMDHWNARDGVGLFAENDAVTGHGTLLLAGVHVAYKRWQVSRYVRVQDRLTPSGGQDETIFEMKGGFYAAAPDKEFDLQELKSTDPRLGLVKLIQEMRDVDRQRAQDRSRRIDGTLPGLLVRPETISIRRGQAKIGTKRELTPELEPL